MPTRIILGFLNRESLQQLMQLLDVSFTGFDSGFFMVQGQQGILVESVKRLENAVAVELPTRQLIGELRVQCTLCNSTCTRCVN